MKLLMYWSDLQSSKCLIGKNDGLARHRICTWFAPCLVNPSASGKVEVKKLNDPISSLFTVQGYPAYCLVHMAYICPKSLYKRCSPPHPVSSPQQTHNMAHLFLPITTLVILVILGLVSGLPTGQQGELSNTSLVTTGHLSPTECLDLGLMAATRHEKRHSRPNCHF